MTVGASRCYAELSSPRGPGRFAQLTPTLYRGAQPNAKQLELLRDLGVKTIVTFITDGDVLRWETDAAAKLGIAVHSYPFEGRATPDPELLERVIAELRDAKEPVYIHCHAGRDRTSLVAALYRVRVQGWDPQLAWTHEASAFGHRGFIALFFHKLDASYAELTKRHA